jgi:nucleoside 2-deoxyribosyltransferase
MKIYFAASIRGGRGDVESYADIVARLKEFGEVLTEHVANSNLTAYGEQIITDESIHKRDMAWLMSADLVVAEVTTPSLGVGYEIGRAVENDIPVICFYKKQKGKRLSAMIAGNKTIVIRVYSKVKELEEVLYEFLNNR